MKKMIIAALSFVMTISAFTACGDNSSSNSTASFESFSESEEESKKVTVVDEPDLMGCFVGDGDTEFIHMTHDELSKATNGQLAKENAFDVNADDEFSVEKFSLGKKDSMLGGRLGLDKEYDITLTLSYKNDELRYAKETIEKITKEEAKKILDDFIMAFDGKLPEGYTQFTPSERGRVLEVGFTKGMEDYVFSMTYDEDLDGDYYVYFGIENYAERYGMKD